MNLESIYLKPNVVAEPLFDRWYAWSHLISPATAAMNVAYRHLNIMNSYLQAPQIHAAAVRNPKMLGGPFMDLEGRQVEEVKVLRDQTMEKQKPLLEFAEAIRELNKSLLKDANGYSLEPMYEGIPKVLRGYVELLYDLNDQASFRMFESLLYKSELYNPDSQTMMLFLTESDGDRPFIFSTPQLDAPHKLHIELPFNHPGWDVLFRMQRTPASYSKICELLEITPEQEPLFRTFFTSTPPPQYKRYTGEGVRTRYFGHACIMVETKDVCILADPVISYHGYDHDVSRLSYFDLPDEIDYVVITHNHQDHILFETMLQLRHRIKHIVVPRNGTGFLQDPNLKLMLNHIGFDNVIEIDEMETIEMDGVKITGLPFIGEHCDLNIRTKICHHIRTDNHSLLLAADSCNVEPVLYEHIQRHIGNVDALFLGMECDGAPLSWLYGPLRTHPIEREKDFSRRLAGSNYKRGMDLVHRFDPREVYVYAMGMEPWLTHITSIKYTPESNPIIASNQLIEECAEEGRVAERLFGEKEILYT